MDCKVWERRAFTAPTKDGSEEVAIKIINKTRLNEKLQEGLSSEIKTMSSITHENIVRLLDIQVLAGSVIHRHPIDWSCFLGL